MFGTCERCGHKGYVEKHHKYPRRFFGDKNNPERVKLCEPCHRGEQGIERLIPVEEEQPKEWYDKLTDHFLNS